MPLAWTKLNGLRHSDRHPALSSTHITCPYYLVNISPRESILPYVKVPILIITFRKWIILLVQIYWSWVLPAPSHPWEQHPPVWNGSSPSCSHETLEHLSLTPVSPSAECRRLAQGWHSSRQATGTLSLTLHFKVEVGRKTSQPLPYSKSHDL